MASKGVKRYVNLFLNVLNPLEYILNKNKRNNRFLHFTTRPNKINFTVTPGSYHVFKEIFMEDVYHIKSLVNKMPSKAVVIDIGANVGFFDWLLLSKVPKATIYAYEPIPNNLAAFQKTFLNNTRIQNSVHMHSEAVTGNLKGILDLYVEETGDSHVTASVYENFDSRNTKKISADCITLEDIITKYELAKIDVLKLDCEGGEYSIIYNSNPLLFQNINLITMELHHMDEIRNNLSAMITYLILLDYKVTYAAINNFCFAVEAIK